ncbi:MAG TPA: MBL fold metallo-hydrolase [Glutamicibacter sp.]|uniref:MBL fold metallo-hydrolase n=1 Tax=Glutamicibacter TaxID=1742989 RepID=UPI000ED6C909|nr:MBL fold metallo-hydrolase [Glutamicibacter sp.]HCJ53323.1 MBL fold metallo-hydrolase [Glutamicibacter sp.]HCM93515.1 MBL fold metallo-hydrolase [Glutamicibacter sp.]
MRITLRGHSCIELATIDGKVLLDPGGFSQLENAFDGINAVLITHEHADHADQPAIIEALETNSVLELYAPAALAKALREQLPPAAQSQVVVVKAGSDFIVGGIRVRTFGGTHATIHHTIPRIANVGYLLGDRAVGQLEVFHPGDSYEVPFGAQPDVLMLPVMAPWGKMAEAADFAVSVNARCWMPIHDGLLNEQGLGLFDRQLGAIAARQGCTYLRVEQGIEHDLQKMVGGKQ